MSEEECADVPGIVEELNGGWWFDGNVPAFMFYLSGVTITGVSGGTSETYLDFSNYNANADCDADGIVDEGCNLFLGTAFSDNSFIPAGIDGLLLSASFTDFDGVGICFDGVGMPIAGSWSPPVIADVDGEEVLADWGKCYCSEDYPADDCGVCGGIGEIDECGCGLPGNCGMQANACDCTGRMPSDKYDAATALVAGDPSLENQYICWDEAEVCDASECIPDPYAVSFNVYRESPTGDLIQMCLFWGSSRSR